MAVFSPIFMAGTNIIYGYNYVKIGNERPHKRAHFPPYIKLHIMFSFRTYMFSYNIVCFYLKLLFQ